MLAIRATSHESLFKGRTEEVGVETFVNGVAETYLILGFHISFSFEIVWNFHWHDGVVFDAFTFVQSATYLFGFFPFFIGLAQV